MGRAAGEQPFCRPTQAPGKSFYQKLLRFLSQRNSEAFGYVVQSLSFQAEQQTRENPTLKTLCSNNEEFVYAKWIKNKHPANSFGERKRNIFNQCSKTDSCLPCSTSLMSPLEDAPGNLHMSKLPPV